MRRQLAVLFVSLLMVPQVIAGQGVRTVVVPGALVRVTHPGEGTRVGTALAITDDLLFVRWRNGSDTVGVPLGEVTRLEVNSGKQKYRALKYGGIGLVGGAGLGAIVGWASYDKSDKSDSFFGQGGVAAAGAFALGSLGGLIGLVSGVLRSEPFQEVSLERSRVGIVAPSGRHGPRLGFALAF